METKLAVVITTLDSPAATLMAEQLGFRVYSPRTPSVQVILNRLPDLILFDWAPGDIRANSRLVEEIRSTSALRLVPLCIVHSAPEDVPTHLLKLERLIAFQIPGRLENFKRALRHLEPSLLDTTGPTDPQHQGPTQQRVVFLGHGHSPLWKDLREFLRSRLKLDCVEFNSRSAAGLSTSERLQEMLGQCCFAFVVLTGEDLHTDTTLHARENATHEVGFFQGRLGFRRAIVLLEAGCQEFSNIVGLGQIRFPKGDIQPAFEEIRMVLEREGIL